MKSIETARANLAAARANLRALRALDLYDEGPNLLSDITLAAEAVDAANEELREVEENYIIACERIMAGAA